MLLIDEKIKRDRGLAVNPRFTVIYYLLCSWTAWGVFLYQQEAQLSQRDRATLRVIDYFAKSLKVTQGHSK